MYILPSEEKKNGLRQSNPRSHKGDNWHPEKEIAQRHTALRAETKTQTPTPVLSCLPHIQITTHTAFCAR